MPNPITPNGENQVTILQSADSDSADSLRVPTNGVARRDHEDGAAQAPRWTSVMERPPASNTGVPFTSSGAILDYLTFTIKAKTFNDLFKLIHDYGQYLCGASVRERSMNGYSDALTVCQTGAILWHTERLDMGLHITLPASALSYWTHLKPDPSLAIYELILKVLSDGGQIRRCDIAKDTPDVTVQVFSSAIAAGECVTMSTKFDGHFDPRTNQTTSVEIGSRSSERFVRIYDKGLQLGGDPGQLTRVELELKGDLAHSAIMAIVMDGAMPESIICSAIDFREVTEDSNVSRRPRLSWWDNLMQGFKRITLGAPTTKSTAERAREWLRKQAAPTLAFLTKLDGGAVDFIYELLAEGVDRIPPYRQSYLRAAGLAT